MIEILLKTIPKGIFEPIAVFGFAGLLLAVVQYRKKHDILYWLLLFSVLFMVFWRQIVHIGSSRYASILIYPCIIGLVYGILQLPAYLERLSGFRDHVSVRWRKMLPYLLLTGLLLACICRSLHYNPYGDYMIRLADTLAQDAKHYQDPCILSAGKNRLAYYSGLPVIDLFGTQDVPETEKTRIREIFYSYPVQKAETVYFVLSEYAADQPGTTLTELPASARQFCTFIDEFYRDTRKKRLSRLFRFDLKDLYRVTLTDFDGWKLTELPKEKIIYEAGFTRKQTSSFYRNTYQFFDENSSSLAKPDLKDFPIGWIVKGTPGFSSPAELGMHVSDNGNTVFRLKSRDLITAYSTTLLAVPTEEGGEWLVEYLVSGGEPDTEFTLAFHCYQGSTYKGMMSLPGRTLKEQSGNRQLYQALIPSDTFGDADTVRVTLLLQHGELFIHGLRISRAEKQ